MKKLSFLLPVLLVNLFFFGQSLEGVDSSHLPAWPSPSPLVSEPSEKEPMVKTITLPNKVVLEYAEQGDANGTPVILLHGFTDSWHSYETVLPHLPSSFRVFALSQRGHGNSSKTAPCYHATDFAGDVAAFMQLKGLKEAVIVGHSMGSTIAQCFVTKHPALVKAIVLVGSFADFEKKQIKDFKSAIDALKDPIDSAFVAGFQQSTILQPTPGLSLDSIVAESRKVPASVWKGVAAGWKVSDFRQTLRNFKKPALIVWGDKDAYCPRADQEQLHKLLERSTLSIYQNTGHALHWEAPERFAKDLVQFVQSLASQKRAALAKR